jgi:hypothetical protein
MARKVTKQLEEQGYSKLDAYCIGLQEFWTSLKRAGFHDEIALAIIVEPSAYPGWILPDPVEPERFGDYEDEDDDY